MSGRLGTVADCILLGQWGLARRLCGHGVGVGAGRGVSGGLGSMDVGVRSGGSGLRGGDTVWEG